MIQKTISFLISIVICITCLIGIKVSAASNNDIDIIIGDSSITIINNTDTARYYGINISHYNRSTGQLVDSSSSNGLLPAHGQVTQAFNTGYYNSTLYYTCISITIYNSTSHYSGIFMNYQCELDG